MEHKEILKLAINTLEEESYFLDLESYEDLSIEYIKANSDLCCGCEDNIIGALKMFILGFKAGESKK